jgi:hypothetical protein
VPAERSGIRPGVNLHFLLATELSASDRAALQSLVPLASALGAGTIFGLFFVGRRRASFAVFESIAIVAVLISVSCTAYYCIALLHRDTAITNKELVETAVPLLVAAVLLILISIVARLRGATQRVMVLLPLVLVAVVAAIEIASSGIVLEPGAAPVVALVILAAAAAFGALGTVADSRARAATRRAEHDRLALLTGLGYAPGEARLAPAVPRLPGDATAPQALDVAMSPMADGLPLDVWRRGEGAFLDGRGAARLRDGSTGAGRRSPTVRLTRRWGRRCCSRSRPSAARAAATPRPRCASTSSVPATPRPAAPPRSPPTATASSTSPTSSPSRPPRLAT